MVNLLCWLRRSRNFALIVLTLSLGACAPLGLNQATDAVVSLTTLPGWSSDDMTGMHAALSRQCKHSANSPARYAKEWPALCRSLPAPQAGALKPWLERNFQARLQRGVPEEPKDAGPVTGLLTGYYEPLVFASRVAAPGFAYPLYQRPRDLLTLDLGSVYPVLKGQRIRGRLEKRDGQDIVVPYHSRADIETSKMLAGQELLFVSDRADAFFLEIQGSGRAQLPDGTVLRIGYADQNGHPYRAIGRLLIDKGAIARDQMSALAIKQWIRANPAQADAVLHSNASQVFFRELPALEGGNTNPEVGPPGSLGVALTPMRSIAVDPRRVALGSLVWITAGPNATPTGPLQRLTLAQDTGGAITGPIRADLFTGFGTQAEELASRLGAPLQLYVLEPRPGR